MSSIGLSSNWIVRDGVCLASGLEYCVSNDVLFKAVTRLLKADEGMNSEVNMESGDKEDNNYDKNRTHHCASWGRIANTHTLYLWGHTRACREE